MDYRVFLAAPLAALVLSVGAAETRMPHDWESLKVATPSFPAVLSQPDYEIGLDPREAATGQPSLTVKSVGTLKADHGNVGAAQQVIHGYAGKRLRLSAQVRSKGASTWAGLFIGEGDNMLLRSLASGVGTGEPHLPMGASTQSADSDWKDVSVVVQVPEKAGPVVLGVALVGEGQVWARKLQFEVVGPQVPVSTTPIGIDAARWRQTFSQGMKIIAGLPPGPLVNPTFD